MDILIFVAFISGFATAAILSDGPSQSASAFWRALEGTWDNIKDVVTLGPMRRRRAAIVQVKRDVARIDQMQQRKQLQLETARRDEHMRMREQRRYLAPGYSIGSTSNKYLSTQYMVLKYKGREVHSHYRRIDEVSKYAHELIEMSWARTDYGIDGQKPTHQPLAEVGQAPVEDDGMCTDGIVETEPLPESGPGLYGMPPEGTFVNAEEVDDPNASVTHIELTQYSDVERVHLDNGTNFLRTRTNPPPYPFTHDQPISD